MYNQWTIIAMKKRCYMKAMILAAGHGTRLRPPTLDRPKTLMPVGNRPMIDRIVEYLKKQGASEIVVNAHHHHGQIVKYLDKGRPFGIHMEVRVEPEILGTGGGIKNTEAFWNHDPFIVINGDILTDIDLPPAIEANKKAGNQATLILHHCEHLNQVQVDNRAKILDISDKSHPGRLAFTGIHIINPELLTHIPEGVYSNIIDCYRELIRSGNPPNAYVSKTHVWRDIGTVRSYVLANKETLEGNPFLLAPGCRIHGSARLKEWAIIGGKTVLEEEIEIRRSVIWENVVVKRGTKVIDSIVTSSKEVTSDLINAIY